MVLSFAHDAALLPLLGAFGEPVRLPNGDVATAIVDFVEGTDESAFGGMVQRHGWHFTMRSTQAAEVALGDTLTSATGRYRVRHPIPEGEGLTTLVATLIDGMGTSSTNWWSTGAWPTCATPSTTAVRRWATGPAST